MMVSALWQPNFMANCMEVFSSPRQAPTVSVIMSCFNAERWVGESIESVLKQTYADLELILIDDGSSDATWKIIEQYRCNDERIVAVKKKNSGLADSLNVGISLAKGKWIARLDADDLCDESRLEQQLGFLETHPDVVLLGTAFIEINEVGDAVNEHRYPASHPSLVRNLEQSRRFFPHSSAMYRTDIVREIGGYNARIFRAEDVRLWLAFSQRGQLACMSLPLLKIRKHPNQISHVANGTRQYFDAVAARVCYFLRKAGVQDPSLEYSDNDWTTFLAWIEVNVSRSTEFQNVSAVENAKSCYRRPGNSYLRLFRLAMALVSSGSLKNIVTEKLFGSDLADRLAKEWTQVQSSRIV